MTAIAGVIEDGKVYIGGDSAGVGGYCLETRSDPKVFKNGEFAMGYTTSFRMGQILQFHLLPPVPLEDQDLLAFMVTRFIPAVRAVLKEHGFQSTDKGEEIGGTFLVGYRGELFGIDSDYQVGRVRQPFHAVGCGHDLVKGSLHATQAFDLSPKERIKMALEAASEFSAGVVGPYEIVSV